MLYCVCVSEHPDDVRTDRVQNAPKTPFSLKAVLLLSLPCVGLTALSLAASPAPTAQTPKKSAAKPPVSAATGKFVAEVRPLLAKHCVVCHNAKSPLGNLDFAHFPDEASVRKDPATWRTIRRRVADKEMPPPTEPPLPEAKRTALLAWIDKTLASLPATATAPKPVAAIPSVRRLTRYEYDRTIKDLIGFEFDSAEAVGMPDDAVPEGFDNRAAALNISPVLMEKYSNAAEKIIEQLIPGPDGRPRVTRDVYEHQMAYRAIFQRGPRNKNVPPREAAQTILSQFARRAYRRSVRETEVERLMQIYDLAVKKGLRQEEAVGWGMRAVLVSPYFLLRVEQPATPPKSASAPTNKLDDYELATRLSYFLWSTMPDEILLDLADQKRLSEPNVLAEQVKRMLADAKAKALTENFAVQWLQLRKLDTARPSIENFPTFNATLREAMRNETTLFFDKLRQEDKPVLDLLTNRWRSIMASPVLPDAK
jgi:mono/diheme cytochrome c family protein